MLDSFIKQNLAVIVKNQQYSGAYPASPYFAPYMYTWFRDGSFVADASSRAGNIKSAERFFSWGARIILDRKDRIEHGETLNTRYTYDGEEVAGEWAEYQLDGYGIFLWALKGHINRHNRSVEMHQDAVEMLQQYLVKHWQEPCFDWWEERIGVHATTLACVYAGLHAYNHPVAQEVKQAIHLEDERIDASLLVCGIFDAVDMAMFAPVLEKIEKELVSPEGGVYRYKNDSYYGGGQWPVLAALLGIYYAKISDTEKVRKQLKWCLYQADEQYWLPEQTQNELLYPEQYEEWVTKLGKPANPLLWSHAMVITLMTMLR